nr:hypothetical protein [Mycoplasmopsis bovis]
MVKQLMLINKYCLINLRGHSSSFAIINSFAKENMIKKIGHTGTLDPLAIRAFISSNWWWHKINSIYKT